jgi:hypothetical protein
MSDTYKIESYTYTDPQSGQQKTGYLKVFYNAQGEPTGQEDEYYGMGAEEWLVYNGFTSLRLLTLLDLEGKLTAAGKTSPKVNSIRAWINSILMEYAVDQADRLTWDAPDYTFQETVQEALTILNS